MTKQLLFSFLFILFHFNNISAQCPSGFNVELETQAEVDDFITNFPNCTEIMGNFRIGSLPSGNLSDISDISGLSFVTKVNSNLLIFRNPNLTSLDGLQNINFVKFSLNISDNNGLTNFSELSNIDSLGSNLIIDNNYYIETLDGLQNISSIPGRIYLANNQRLKNILAFSNLQSVGGDFDIRINLDLQSLAGLEQLTSVGEDFILQSNIELTDLSALEHTLNIGGELEITSNSLLSNCAVLAVCNFIEANGTTDISNNSTDCNSETEIASLCESVATFETMKSKISIYPNPTTDFLFIKNENETPIQKILIYDFLGKEQFDISKNKTNINLSQLKSGVYFINFWIEDQLFVKKILVQ